MTGDMGEGSNRVLTVILEQRRESGLDGPLAGAKEIVRPCSRKLALLKQVWVGLRPVGSADKSGAAEERWLGTEVDSRL